MGKTKHLMGIFRGNRLIFGCLSSLVGQHCDLHLMSFTKHLLGVFHGNILYQPFIGVLKGNMSSKFFDPSIRKSTD